MKNIRFLLLMVVAVLMGACDKNDDPIPTPPVEKTEMTVMAYFVADNNLDQYLKQNITMMCEGLMKINKPATLLVYWDGKAGSTYWSEPCILKYVTDGEGRLNGQDLNLKTAGGSYDTKLWDAAEVIPTEFTASTEKESMAGVLKQMLALSPSSDYYGLVAGSHGSGWLKYITGSNSRSFGQDGALTNTISTADMAEAVAAMGKKLDFFLFDACMMGCAEVCYDFRHVADYMIASVVDVPAIGFPYDEMLPYLYAHSPENYAEACRIYIDYYRDLRSQGYWGTMSLIDCRELETLGAMTRSQLEEHADGLAGYDPVQAGLQQYGLNPSYAPSFKYISFDMKQFIKELNNGTCPASFEEQLSRTVLYAGYVENTYEYTIDGDNYCGLGMYVPVSTKSYWNEYFRTLEWYTDAGWGAAQAG